MKNWTAIVADDEPHLRQAVVALLEKQWPELEILDQANNGIQALEMIQTLKPDMAFLDIQMPGMTGLEVARAAAGATQVVFITAYDQYAVEAFENAAMDYLLKPVSKQRLAVTIDRLRQRLEKETAPPGSTGPDPSNPIPTDRERLEQALQILAHRAAPDHLRLIKVKVGTELRFIPVSKIFFFKAEDKYTRVLTLDAEYLIRTPVKELEEQLDPSRFWRVHRSSIVNVDRIKVIKRSFTYQMRIGFDGLEETLAVSRAHEHRFKHM